MKTNLTKKNIERGCGLVAQYKYFKDDSVRGDFNYHLRHVNSRLDIERMPDSPFYRDFLQLVLEAISKKSKNKIYFTTYFLYNNKIKLQINYGINSIMFLDEDNITTAKEKAISYYFDNKGFQ